MFVGDDVESIAIELRQLSKTYELILTSGGMGPTPDDVTMAAVAAAMDLKLIRNPQLEQQMRTYFKENITAAHLKMTETPEE